MEQKDIEWELEEGIPQLEDPFIQQYLKGRDSLISEEQKQRHDANFRKALTPMAARACEVVARIRDQEYRQMLAKHRDGLDDLSNPAETSRLWKVVQRLPKGSLLHIYLHAAVDIEFIINEALATPGLHICASRPFAQEEDYKNVPFHFRYATKRASGSGARPNIWTRAYNPGDLVPVSEAATLFPDGGETGFRRWIQQRCISTQHESGQSTVTDKITTLSEESLPILSSLLSYEPILRSCLRRIFKQLAADNIRYAEFRNVFSAPFTLEGGNTPEDGYTAWCRVFQEEVEQFKGTDEGQSFHGARVIWATLRSLPTKQLVQNMQECVLAKLDVPGVICGYDIAGPEDGGKALVELVPLLFYFRKLCAEEGVVIPFLFHAGGCFGDDDTVDRNLFDAILLGTRRIGQGSSLHRHPLLVDLVKEKKILIESCLHSHGTLDVEDAIQSRSLLTLLSRGVPVALCSDTPGAYGQNANTLTPEYWTALQGLEGLGLTGIAMMMENSIRWSCYEDQTPSEWLSGIREGVTGNGVKASRLREWYEEFEKFCEWILEEFPELDLDD
ncbi:putative CECR1 family adenosine deaminase [Aspergillus campestris IBT 28561]|uniref:adenosine deaminase n=1 Tax=Aspergillus campestris (strain IBT 28561) TaxID=1392248 RepID=A0A2I1DA30_ASPC2|nr:putative CECR1 family adenosine deaminase [Aspergillus campestris IBT 28561]PKY06726.1 putative CECR1 family adenosine deaminase [Aspergillus campestris IBT 28561]